MGAEPERSEALFALPDSGTVIARQLTAIALGLPLHWSVTLDDRGQVRILPPFVPPELTRLS